LGYVPSVPRFPMSTFFEVYIRFAWILLLSLGTLVMGQVAPPRPKFWDHATIEQRDGRAWVRANDPRPLEQATEAIAKSYGWVVDYEDPPYGPADWVDNTDPAWRKAHPTEKGVHRVAGGMFEADFPLGSDMSAGSPDEERVLDKVVADYAASGNPGQFEVKKEIAGRYALVGVGAKDSNGRVKRSAPVLDTRISLAREERSAADTINLIARLLSAKSGYNIEAGWMAVNLLNQTRVNLGGSEQPARELLMQVASATRFLMTWRLRYDSTGRVERTFSASKSRRGPRRRARGRNR